MTNYNFIFFIFALLLLMKLKFSTCNSKSLSYYNADKRDDVEKLKQWYKDISSMNLSDGDAFKQLESESKSNKDMLGVFRKANEAYSDNEYQQACSKFQLSKAECCSVRMYTDEGFHKIFNNEIRKYEVFAKLLFSAINKINVNGEKLVGLTVYRGMRQSFSVPDAKTLYFGTFMSTSKNKTEALKFGNKTFFTIKISVNVIAAYIANLSVFPYEKEILFSPFVLFDNENNTSPYMFFKTSSKQEFQVSTSNSAFTKCPFIFLGFMSSLISISF